MGSISLKFLDVVCEVKINSIYSVNSYVTYYTLLANTGKAS
jgi:hypothetical protein